MCVGQSRTRRQSRPFGTPRIRVPCGAHPRTLIGVLPPPPATSAGREIRLLEEDDGRWSAIDEQTGVAGVIAARKRWRSSTRWWCSTGAKSANLSPTRTRYGPRFRSRRTTGTGRAVVRFRGVGVARTRFTGRTVRRNEMVPPGHDTLQSIADPTARFSARTHTLDVRSRSARSAPTAVLASILGSSERS
jgi:hypothetical protein